MHIKLIAPGSVMYRGEGGIFPRILRYAPLTLSTLASLVPSEVNANIELCDEISNVINYDDKPDLVGLSVITGTSNRCYTIADHYRRKGVTVVLGGAHVTLQPEEALKHADAIVTGMSYQTFPELMKDFRNGELKRHYKQGTVDLRNLPNPRRDLLPDWTYLTKDSTQATFGCPHTCDFCAVANTSEAYLNRPISDVISEINTFKGHFFTMMDPSPTEGIKYWKEFLKELAPLKKKWGGLGTSRIVNDPEMMDLLAESGCKGILIGFETITQEGNNDIHKKFNDPKKYGLLINELHFRGIAINGTFMFGMDSHTKDIFHRTVDFVIEHGIELPRFSIFTPFPGTPSHQRLKTESRLHTDNWTLYDVQHAVHKPRNMTVEDLWEGTTWAWEQTYSVKNILSRLTTARTGLTLQGITNLGYKYYADRLRRFPESEVLRLEKEWNDTI